MKRVVSLLLLLSVLPLGAQIITYDTIRVSADDERNIHLNRSDNVKATSKPLRKEDVYAGKERSSVVFDRTKLRFGANLGLSVSRNYTNLGLGPQIGYQFNDYFMTGAGIKYYYTRALTNYYEIKNNLLGANLFGYLYPLNFLAIFAQPEINYIWSTLIPRDIGDKTKDSGLVPSLVVGAGFRLGRSHITLNYDLVQHSNSPHPDGFYLGVSAFF